MSDRDVVLQWLARRLAERRGHGGVWHGDLIDAAAILDTPGVDIVSRNYWAPGNPIGDDPDGVRLLLCLPPMLTGHAEKINEEKR